MVKEKKPSFLFLMETISKRKKLDWLRVRLGFEGMFVVDPVGRSGGLALFWKEGTGLGNSELLSATHQCRHQWNGHEQELETHRILWQPNTSKRDESWDLMRILKQFSPRPWLCVGDFNEITDQHEKEGGNIRKESQMEKFREAIDNCSLCDLGFSGSKYTWSNGHSDGSFTKERLDRALANVEWVSVFKEVEVRIEAKRASDHNPVLIEFHEEKQEKRCGHRGFKFEAKWWVDDECGSVIKSAWEAEGLHANRITVVRNKLQQCQKVLSGWSRRKFGDTEERLKSKNKELVKLTQAESSSNQGAIKKLQDEIDEILEQEDVRWKQRSKQNWYMQGDRNTKFFHAWASHRRKVNTIRKIKDNEGREWKKEKEIGRAFIHFYEDLYTAEPTARMKDCLQGLESPCHRCNERPTIAEI
jgi:hypothetical protein